MAGWTMALVLALSMSPGPALPDWDAVTAVPADAPEPPPPEGVQRRRADEERLRQLVAFMFGAEGLAFGYDNSVTRTVAETLRDRRGNCLSFTLAFVALARDSGLDAYVQETDDVLVWEGGAESRSIFHTGHVNAGVRIRGARYTVDFDRRLVLSRNQPRTIDATRVLAHFYNNRGAELMEDGDFAGARRYFDGAIALAPGFVPALNNLGVLLSRAGDKAGAERAYLAALEESPEDQPSLSNLVNLYREQGRRDEIERYQRVLDEAARSDPFRNFVVGVEQERLGNDEAARDAYRRAIRLHEREPQFHMALARVLDRLGESWIAESERRRAEVLGRGRNAFTRGELRDEAMRNFMRAQGMAGNR